MGILFYFPYYGKCRIYIINRMVVSCLMCFELWCFLVVSTGPGVLLKHFHRGVYTT